MKYYTSEVGGVFNMAPGDAKNYYEVMESFLTEVSRTEILTVLEAAKSFLNIF